MLFKIRNFFFLPQQLLLPLLIFVVNHSQGQAIFNEGKWYRIGVKETGIYQLNANFFKKNKLKIADINPKNIRIFSVPPGMLPQSNAAKRNGDLLEMSIQVLGEADGKFDASDAVLFFGESPDAILIDPKTGLIRHQKHLYSDSSFYFLNIGNITGKRIKNNTESPVSQEVNTFQRYQYREQDIKNMVGSGREWVGEYFGVSGTQIFKFPVLGIVPKSKIQVSSETMAATTSVANFVLKINEDSVFKHTFDPVGSGRFDTKGRLDFLSKSLIFNGKDSVAFKYIFSAIANASGLKTSEGYLNFLGLQTEHFLSSYPLQITAFIPNISNQKNVALKFEKIEEGFQIWNISNLQNIDNQVFKLEKTILNTSQNQVRLQFFSTKNLLIPTNLTPILSQNIRAYPTPTLLIITAPRFVAQAEKLATFRKQKDNIETIVVRSDAVFNAFSGGKQDPTAIRDYIKFLYDKAPTQLKYVLLFGDANFDYRNNYQSSDFDTNALLPTYESRQSFHPVMSYASDDYYGFLEANEGEWPEDAEGNHSLEVSVGRFPVKTELEAAQLVDKMIYYATSKNNFGPWRTQVSFVADDGDSNIHQQNAEELSGFLLEKNTQFSVNKIYIDAFPQVASANGIKAPAVNAEIKRSGLPSLVMNYNGHGGTSGLAEEQIVTSYEASAWQNRNTMPLLFTATCDFGRFDSPVAVSGAELALLNPRGGAIALLSTCRPVYSSTNFTINKAFYEALSQLSGSERLGDVHRKTKNRGIDDIYNRNFSLLGDPSMKLSLPENTIEILKINGKPAEKDTLKALQKTKIEGRIKGDKFSGLMRVEIFDKPKQSQTLGAKSYKMTYNSYQNKLFDGLVSVRNNVFSLEFIVPKDIDYKFGKGRIECYAVNTDSTQDAAGTFSQLMVGGSESNFNIDTKPPTAKLAFLDASPEAVPTNAVFTAIVNDESGFTISEAGIGHEPLLILDDSIRINVRQYLKMKPDDFQNGQINYPFYGLKTGEHSIQLKIWDTQNNSSTVALLFKVVKGKSSLATTAFPNPFREQVQVKALNPLVGQNLMATFRVVEATGRVLYSDEEFIPNADAELYFSWIPDLTLPDGMYYYGVTLRGKNESKTGGGTIIFWK